MNQPSLKQSLRLCIRVVPAQQPGGCPGRRERLTQSPLRLPERWGKSPSEDQASVRAVGAARSGKAPAMSQPQDSSAHRALSDQLALGLLSHLACPALPALSARGLLYLLLKSVLYHLNGGLNLKSLITESIHIKLYDIWDLLQIILLCLLFYMCKFSQNLKNLKARHSGSHPSPFQHFGGRIP